MLTESDQYMPRIHMIRKCKQHWRTVENMHAPSHICSCRPEDASTHLPINFRFQDEARQWDRKWSRRAYNTAWCDLKPEGRGLQESQLSLKDDHSSLGKVWIMTREHWIPDPPIQLSDKLHLEELGTESDGPRHAHRGSCTAHTESVQALCWGHTAWSISHGWWSLFEVLGNGL